MKSEEFTSFEESQPDKKKHIIVTNNIDAKNAHGEMSHVWLTTFYTAEDGVLVTFDEADRLILALTHWKYA